MPATVPSGWPKNGSNGSPREKVGPTSKSGSMGSGATPLNSHKGGKLEKWVQDVSETHDTTRYNDGSSTSTTYRDYTPAKGAGYCCSNGWGCEVTGRDGQEPIEEQPPPSQTNKILQRGWMNTFEPSGPDWQSEWLPQGIKAGSGCSYEKGAAGDGNGGHSDGKVPSKPWSKERREGAARSG